MGRITLVSKLMIVDAQKRITLGSAAEPGQRFSVETDESNDIILTPLRDGGVLVDDRRRIPLGRMVRAGDFFGLDLWPDGRIMLNLLWVVDPKQIDSTVLDAVREGLVS